MSGTSNDDELRYLRKSRGILWLDDEIEMLLQFYFEVHTNSKIWGKYCTNGYEKIAEKLKAIGYNRNVHQIRTKITTLKFQYNAIARGSELDHQNCFLYDELEKCFGNTSEQQLHRNDDAAQMSPEDQVDRVVTSSPDGSFTSGESDIYDEVPKTKKPRITSTTNIEKVSMSIQSETKLMEFMSHQFERQRQYQLKTAKMFITAMSEQMEQFSDLIKSLTKKDEVEYVEKRLECIKNEIRDILDAGKS